MFIVKTKIYCKRCSHSWYPRKPISEIVICPGCRSPYWNRPRKGDKR